MRGTRIVVTIGLMSLPGLPGCVDRTPPPANARIPQERGAMRYDDPVKPLPRPGEGEELAGSMPPPPFNDAPLVSQDTPEQRAFVDAYNAVGRPRIVVFVNRTLEGEMLPVNAGDPVASVERTRKSKGEVTVEARDRRNTDAHYRDRFGDADARADRDSTDRYEARGKGPNEYRDRVDVYLRPGQYDEASARQIDYEAIEAVLTDWLAAGGRTEIVSPVTARQRLSDEQVKDLQSGRPRVMGEVARALDADVLVQVSARPTRQTPRGLEVRLVAEAINVGKGGQSVGRAVVDMPPPLDKPRINKFTRFLARVLMDRMIGTWENRAPDRLVPGAREPGPGDDRSQRPGDPGRSDPNSQDPGRDRGPEFDTRQPPAPADDVRPPTALPGPRPENLAPSAPPTTDSSTTAPQQKP